jgi:thiol-disulfide isomerase/thioredoxin
MLTLIRPCRFGGLLICLLGLLPAAGCGPSAQTSSSSEESIGHSPATEVGSEELAKSSAAESGVVAETPAGGDAPTSAGITVETLATDQLADLVARHTGHVVLIDFWATWCGPCLQQFPHTIEMSHQYEDAGLRVLAVSCDDPEDRPKVVNTLGKLGATIENYQTDGDLQQTFDAFDIRGGIPFYQLYDRHGVLRYRFNGAPAPGDEAESTEMLDIRIRELLDEV